MRMTRVQRSLCSEQNSGIIFIPETFIIYFYGTFISQDPELLFDKTIHVLP